MKNFFGCAINDLVLDMIRKSAVGPLLREAFNADGRVSVTNEEESHWSHGISEVTGMKAQCRLHERTRGACARAVAPNTTGDILFSRHQFC